MHKNGNSKYLEIEMKTVVLPMVYTQKLRNKNHVVDLPI